MKKRIVSLLLAAALLTGAASAAGEEGAAEQPDLDLSAASDGEGDGRSSL